MSVKLDRLGHIFTEAISKIINEEVKDDDIKFVTITAVDITNDLSYAKVYFTNLIDTDREKVTKALNRASSFIRGKLFDEVEIRKMPELTFVYDESIEYGNKIEKIIDEIRIVKIRNFTKRDSSTIEECSLQQKKTMNSSLLQ